MLGIQHTKEVYYEYNDANSRMRHILFSYLDDFKLPQRSR